jgi:peroxiredoxin
MTSPASPEVPRKRRWRRWVRDIALLLLVLVAVQWWQTRDAPSGPAPALTGQLLDGRLVSLADYRGRPVLVYFWATWCPVCRLSQGSIDALAQDHAVLAVASNSGDAAEIAAFMREEGLSFPVLLDEAGDLGRRWQVRGVPTSFVVDAAGHIAHVAVGYTTGIGLRARLWLAGR